MSSSDNSGKQSSVAAAFASGAADNNAASNANEKIPELPAADPNDKDIPTIQLGETIKFDEMGPVIINTDGSTRRIDNWQELSEKEKEVTWRRISKRNEERRKALLEQAEQANKSEGNCQDEE